MHYRFAFYVLRRVLVHVISVLLLKIILPSRIWAVILFIKFLVFSMQVRFTDDIDDILFFLCYTVRGMYDYNSNPKIHTSFKVSDVYVCFILIFFPTAQMPHSLQSTIDLIIYCQLHQEYNYIAC